MNDVPKVVLVDGSNLLMRCIKAMEYRGLRSGEDWQTGPLVAFIGALARIVREQEPDYMVVCWDAGPCVRRTALYPAYKANRAQPDPEAKDRKDLAFGMTKNFLGLAGIQQVAVQGFEADDVVAAYWAMTKSFDTVIVSGDKDFFQLLDYSTTQLRPDNGGTYEEWTSGRVQREYGCSPRLLPLLLALVGDPTDGVPGVRGLGPKKALKALQDAEWVLPEVVALKDPEKLDAAFLSWELIELREESAHPEVPPLHPFAPLGANDLAAARDLVVFLRALGMESVLSKFYTNTLWH